MNSTSPIRNVACVRNDVTFLGPSCPDSRRKRDTARSRGADSGMVARVATSGVLYGVFDYVDEPRRLNKIRGGAIIRQLVCSGYCYLMLMPWEGKRRSGPPLIPSVVLRFGNGGNNGFRTHRAEKARPPPSSPSSQPTHRGGARRSRLWNAARVPIRRVPSGSFRPVRHVPAE